MGNLLQIEKDEYVAYIERSSFLPVMLLQFMFKFVEKGSNQNMGLFVHKCGHKVCDGEDPLCIMFLKTSKTNNIKKKKRENRVKPTLYHISQTQ